MSFGNNRDELPAPFTGYRIEEDLPGERLYLRWVGFPPRLLGRVLPMLLVAILLPILLWSAWSTFRPDWDAFVAANDPTIVMILQAGVTVVALAVTTAALKFACGISRSLGYWHDLAWDKNQQMVIARFTGFPFLGSKQLLIPFRSVETTSLTTGPEGTHTLALELTIMYRREDNASDWLKLPLFVDHVDRRGEAMDLGFRMARVMGWQGYYFGANTHRRLELWLLPKLLLPETLTPEEKRDLEEEFGDDLPVSAAPEALAIPEIGTPARYEVNVALPNAQPPKIAIPPLDLKVLAEKVQFTKVLQWKPGERIHIRREGASWGMTILLGVVVGLIGMMVGPWFLFPLLGALTGEEVPTWIVLLLSALPASVGVLIGLWPRLREHEIIFDWKLGKVLCKTNSQAREYYLSDVKGLALGGARRITQGRSQAAMHENRCQLHVLFSDAEELVIETDAPESEGNTPYRMLLPITDALAKTLAVPWHWAPYEGGLSSPRWWRWPAVQGGAAALVVAILVVLFFYRSPRNAVSEEVLAHIRQTSAEPTFLDASSFRDIHSVPKFWKIEFPSHNATDDILAQLETDFSSIGRIGFELDESPVGDQGLAVLSRVPGLVYMTLYATEITDRGVAHLESAESLEYLSLAGTNVGDEGIASLAKLPNLAILILNGTRVSDAGLLRLAESPSLKYLSIGGLDIQPETKDKLRVLNPGLQFDR